MGFDFSSVIDYWPELLDGAIATVQIVVLAVLLGFALGMVLAVAHWSGDRTIRTIIQVYVEVFRTTPALLQLMYVYLVLPEVAGINLGPITTAWVTLGLNTAAFFSEILRAGLQSVDKTQSNAAVVLRLSKADTFRFVIFPQLMRNIFPPTVALFITVIKYSSLAAGIGALELTRVGQLVAVESLRLVEILTIVAVIYFVMAYPLAILARTYEVRLRRGMY
ncbi:MAG: amino acid ABC transporter permease [Pseudomonadota bacterium]